MAMKRTICMLFLLAFGSLAWASADPSADAPQSSARDQQSALQPGLARIPTTVHGSEDIESLKARLYEDAAAAGVEIRDVRIEQRIDLGELVRHGQEAAEVDDNRDARRSSRCRASAAEPDGAGVTVSVTESDCVKAVHTLDEHLDRISD